MEKKLLVEIGRGYTFYKNKIKLIHLFTIVLQNKQKELAYLAPLAIYIYALLWIAIVYS